MAVINQASPAKSSISGAIEQALRQLEPRDQNLAAVVETHLAAGQAHQ